MKIWNVRNGVRQDAIYVGRANSYKGLAQSKWHNPFKLQAGETAGATIERFRAYAEAKLAADPTWVDELIGKDLQCWCLTDDGAGRRSGHACHAEVLRALAQRRQKGANDGR